MRRRFYRSVTGEESVKYEMDLSSHKAAARILPSWSSSKDIRCNRMIDLCRHLWNLAVVHQASNQNK